MPLRILIVDDMRSVRHMQRLVLERRSQYQVVGEAADGIEAVKLAKTLEPDIVLMDVAMPKMDGLDATRLILQEQPHIKIIAFTVHGEQKYIRMMLKAGCVGFVDKEEGPLAIVKAVDVVATGCIHLSPGTFDEVVKGFVDHDDCSPGKLTARENEILSLIEKAESMKNVIAALGITPQGAYKARAVIMKKLGVKTPGELVKMASQIKRLPEQL